jgi:hypothetical protein
MAVHRFCHYWAYGCCEKARASSMAQHDMRCLPNLAATHSAIGTPEDAPEKIVAREGPRAVTQPGGAWTRNRGTASRREPSAVFQCGCEDAIERSQATAVRSKAASSLGGTAEGRSLPAIPRTRETMRKQPNFTSRLQRQESSRTAAFSHSLDPKRNLWRSARGSVLRANAGLSPATLT